MKHQGQPTNFRALQFEKPPHRRPRKFAGCPLCAHLIFALIALAFILPALAIPAAAQWLNFPTPGIPRTADGKPDLTAAAPRTTDGKPDLSGLWQPEANNYGFNL